MSDLMGFLFDRFSILFLKKRLTITQWFGILTVVSGLVVVGVSDLLFDKTPEGNHTSGEKVLGIGLILLAMIFTSLQVRSHSSEDDVSLFIGRIVSGRLRGTFHRWFEYSTASSRRLGGHLWLSDFGSCSHSGQSPIPEYPSSRKQTDLLFCLVPFHLFIIIACKSRSPFGRYSRSVLPNG